MTSPAADAGPRAGLASRGVPCSVSGLPVPPAGEPGIGRWAPRRRPPPNRPHRRPGAPGCWTRPTNCARRRPRRRPRPSSTSCAGCKGQRTVAHARRRSRRWASGPAVSALDGARARPHRDPPPQPGARRPGTGAAPRRARRRGGRDLGRQGGLSPPGAGGARRGARPARPPVASPVDVPLGARGRGRRRGARSWPTSSPPNRPTTLAKLADEAAISRLSAGTNVRSDVEAGTAIGRAVAERAVARGQADGSDAVWDGSGRPTGDGSWQPTPPRYRPATARPVGRHLDAMGARRAATPTDRRHRRPGARPPGRPNSRRCRRPSPTGRPSRKPPSGFWAGGPGTVTPAGLWTQIARDLVVRDGLDLPHAARVLALTTVAMSDAFVCCWDAKYAYWSARPITADPTLDVLIPTPPFPSYTSGHSTISAAAATVLGHLFPADAGATRGEGERGEGLPPLGGDPLPDRQRDGRDRRRHGRAAGGRPGSGRRGRSGGVRTHPIRD